MPKLTREIQLSWFESGSVIRQDQDLINTIVDGQYTQAVGYGNIDYFKNHINFVNSGPVDFCIYIVNKPFDFVQLIEHVNDVIKTQLNNNSLIYLSINKYLTIPKLYDSSLADDYDCAIEQFVAKNVNAQIERYHSCGNDGGNQFNWVHPLTRFYLRVQSVSD